MNKRRIFQWVAIALVLVLVLGVVWLLVKKDAQNKPQDNLEPSQTQGSQNDTEQEEPNKPQDNLEPTQTQGSQNDTEQEEPNKPQDNLEPTQTQGSQNDTEQEEPNKPQDNPEPTQTQGNQNDTEQEEPNKPQDNLEPTQTQGNQNDTEQEEPTTQTKPSAPTNYISFPYRISGTPLVIEQVNSYDGIFFEDGSDKEMSNVTAIVLKNTGDECVNYLDISIERDGTKLRFAGSVLGPGDTAIVLEANAKQFGVGKYSNCEAEIATDKEMEMSQAQVRVEDTAENDLLVTNISAENISCIRVYYKFYMYDEDVYVGGITYSAKLVDLAAGDSFVIRPSHYIRGYSKVVMVKTYDSDE